MRTVFVTAPFPGVLQVARHGERLGLWSVATPDAEGHLAIPPAESYILGAWDPMYDKVLEALVGRGARVGVCWTSSVGEMGFEPVELGFLSTLLLDGRISFIWCGEPSIPAAIGGGAFYAPYPVDMQDHRSSDKSDTMVLFCPSTAKKNVENQLFAAKLIQCASPNLVLHTNVELPGAVGPLLKLNLVRHSWLPPDDYRQFLRSAKLALGVSYAETFNYGLAEAVMCGTPCVSSPTVPFLSRLYQVRDANDPTEIAAVGTSILSRWSDAAQDQYEALSEYASSANLRLTTELRRQGVL